MARDRTIKIDITAANKASKAIDNVIRSLGGIGKAAEGASGGSGILRESMIGVFSSTILGGFRKLTDSIMGIGKSAIGAVGNIQMLELSLKALLTENAMFGEVNKTREVTIRLTDKEKQKVHDLTLKYRSLGISMQMLGQKIVDNSKKHGAHSLIVAKQNAQLDELANRHGKLGAEINALTSKEGKLVTVTDTRISQVMEYDDAMAEAEIKVRTMMDAIANIALKSPFETAQVEQIAQIGLAYGLAEEEVTSFTAAFLDYAAAHPMLSQQLAYSAGQFLEFKAIMKLGTMDLRQLSRRGLDVARVLRVDLGMSVEDLTERFGDLTDAQKKLWSEGMTVKEFNAAIEKSPELMDTLFQKFTVYAEKTTAGAAEAMTITITGMMSTMADIVEIGSRKLFRPVIEAVSPALAGVLGQIIDFVTSGTLEAKGREMGWQLAKGLEAFLDSGIAAKIKKVIGAVKIFFKLIADRKRDIGVFEALQKALEWVIPKKLATSIVGFLKRLNKLRKAAINLVKRGLSAVSDWFKRHGSDIAKMGERIGVAIGVILDKLSVSGEGAGDWLETIINTILTLGLKAFGALVILLELLAENWALVENAALGFAIVLAGGVILSSISKLTRMLNPMYLVLIAIGTVVRLLGKAWSENWGGIKDTLLGVWDKMKPVVDAIGGFVSGLLGVFKTEEGETNLASMVEKLGESLKKMGLSEEVVARIKGMATSVGLLIESFKLLVTGDIAGAVDKLGDSVGIFAEQVLGMDAAKAESLANSVERIADSIVVFVEAIPGLANEAWQRTLEWLKENGDGLKTSLSGIGEAIARVVSVLGEDVELGTFAEEMEKLQMTALDSIANSLEGLSISLGMIADALERIDEFFDFLTWLSEKEVDIPHLLLTKEVEMGIEEPDLTATQQALKEALDGLMEGALEGVTWQSQLEDKFTTALVGGGDVLEEAGGARATAFTDGFENSINAWEPDVPVFASAADLFNAVVTTWTTDMPQIYGPLNEYETAVTGTFQRVSDEVIEYSIVPDMISNIILAFQGLALSVAATLEGYVLAVTTPFTMANLAIINTFRLLKTELVNLIIPPLVADVVRLLSGIPTLAATAIRTKLPVLKEVGREIVASIKKGIENAWDKFQSWVAERIKGLIRAILKSMGMGSPSKVLVGIGENMVLSLQRGWDNAFGDFEQNVAGSFGGLFGDLAVTPALGVSTSQGTGAQAARGGNVIGGDTFNVYNYNRATAQLTNSMIEDRRRQRLNAFMGA